MWMLDGVNQSKATPSLFDVLLSAFRPAFAARERWLTAVSAKIGGKSRTLAHPTLVIDFPTGRQRRPKEGSLSPLGSKMEGIPERDTRPGWRDIRESENRAFMVVFAPHKSSSEARQER